MENLSFITPSMKHINVKALNTLFFLAVKLILQIISVLWLILLTIIEKLGKAKLSKD
jgi:hypothetical protein